MDPSKRLVWVESFRAETHGPVDEVKGIKAKVQRRFDVVLEDLLKQSRDGMLASPEIREFARTAPRAGR